MSKESNLAAVRLYRKEHSDRVAAQKNNWNKRHPEKLKEYGRRSRLTQALKAAGITITEWLEARERSGNACEICGNNPRKKRLDIDHNHETGKFRGLLCSRCNLVLGRVEDSVELLNTMIKYLEERN